MDFVFFDIECCDGNHMFSFGYVITDDIKADNVGFVAI